MAPKCTFYRKTADGYRCVLVSLEDWSKVKERKLEYCLEIGRCPLATRILKLSARIKPLKEG